MRVIEKLKDMAIKKRECSKLAEVKGFMAEINMDFNGYGGLNIHRLVVSEFGYLLRYLTGGEIDSFSDFRVIAENKLAIEDNIKKELARDVLHESEVFGYSRDTTEGNILRLQKIVNSICEYTVLCDELGVDIYAARSGV